MTQTFKVNEDSSAIYRCTLEDENGDPVSVSQLLTLTLTLFDVATETIINERDAQDVLNKEGVTVDANGLLTWDVEAEDNVIVTRLAAVRGAREKHIADLHWTWANGGGTHRVEIVVLQAYPLVLPEEEPTP